MIDNKKTRKEIVMSLPEIEAIRNYFITQPVEKVWIFGSYARGEQTPESDIDVLIAIDYNAKVGLFKLGGMYADLQELCNKKVDLVTDGGLRSFARESVNNDKILIYERATTGQTKIA